ncbi:FG-GAP repeat domain-containing protein [Streptomyces sp. A5-4]|uniref:FG-GAP repeat domain-containing protein n=1 Tax=Streptomyces sp. A5-4 TaxID=3384771 RepID=UPI003DA7FD08
MRTFFSRGGRRLGVIGGTAALLATGAVGAAGPAFADDPYGFDDVRNFVLEPGEGSSELNPLTSYGIPDGTLVYALSKKPLTDPAWTAAGLPAGMKVQIDDGCRAATGSNATYVYVCPVNQDSGFPGPRVSAAASAASGSTLHYGLTYAPRGTDINKAVKAAQTVGSVPDDTRHAARTVKLRTAAEVAKNTMKLSTPGLPAGGSVTQSVTVHAVDAGRLSLTFEPSAGQRRWDEDEAAIEITGVTGGANASCDHTVGDSLAWGEVRCDVTPGDITVTYTLKGAADLAAWRVDTNAVYEVFTWGTHNPEARSAFQVQSTLPVRERFSLFARTKSGEVYEYQGTGKASAPFGHRESIGSGWQTYNRLTKLSPVTSHRTGGGVVGQDKAGVLWHYRTTDNWTVFAPRTKVGSGWGRFNSLVGTGDATGDGKPDMIARDADGVLYLYKGSGDNAAPFAPRTTVGSGWGKFNALTAVGDATGDGKADLIARDAAGTLYLYKGTGNAAAPFASRTTVGTGWGKFNTLAGLGDLNSDGRADLIARDGDGVLHLYKGTGDAAAPFASRTKIGTGWGQFDAIF